MDKYATVCPLYLIRVVVVVLNSIFYNFNNYLV